MKYLYDYATWTDEMKILTADTLSVPGMEMFGYNSMAGNLHVLPPHMHETTEFLYVANGTQQYYIGDTSYELKGNQVMVVDGDQIHSTGDSPYGRYENLWFRLNLREFTAGVGLPPTVAEHACSSLSHMKNPVISVPDHWYRNLKKIFFDLADIDPCRQLCGHAAFVGFIAELVKNTDAAPRYSEDIHAALAYIDEHVGTHVTLEELAALVGLSLSGFKQKFKRETGVTPREHINLLKIKKAKELLSQGYTVTQTAYALDFGSSSHFSYAFHRVEGVTPTQFVRQK